MALNSCSHVWPAWVERGYALSDDDKIRRFAIAELMCNFQLDATQVRERFGVDLLQYFAREIEGLSTSDGPVADGLLEVSPESLTVTTRGRLFVRNICMAFDRYLAAHQDRPVFSRTI